MSSLNYKGIPISTTNNYLISNLNKIIDSPKFIRYINSIDNEIINIKGICIESATWFCEDKDITPEKLGYAYLEIDAIDNRTGKKIPGTVFLRGTKVAIQIEVEDSETGRISIILCHQVRIPVGKIYAELPSGLIDATGNVIGPVFKLISYITNIQIPNTDHMENLGSKIYTSSDISNESIKFFRYRVKRTTYEISQIREQIYANEDEKESIQLSLIELEKYEHVLDQIGDVKAECAFRRTLNLYRKKYTEISKNIHEPIDLFKIICVFYVFIMGVLFGWRFAN